MRQIVITNQGVLQVECPPMTHERAIEILHDILQHVEPGDPPEEHQAITMAMGALIADKLNLER
ncbi:hypothetical protein ES705_24695 [subsurface metagenome]